MKTANYGWQQRLRELYDKAQVKYSNDNRKVETMFTPREVNVLREFGAKPMELYDYAEDTSDLDWVRGQLLHLDRLVGPLAVLLVQKVVAARGGD